MIKTISTIGFAILAITLGAPSNVQAGTYFSGILNLSNTTPHQPGGLGGTPPDTYFDSWNQLLNVHRDMTLPTEDTGGAVLGATGRVSTQASVTGNDLGQFGIHAFAMVNVPVGAPFGHYEGISITNCYVQDTWYLYADPRYANLRVRGKWTVSGGLGSDVQDSPITAFASSIIRFFGSGVAPGLRAYSQRSTQTPYNFVAPPTVISLDMVFRNGVGSPYNFEADTDVNASVDYLSNQLQYPLGSNATATLDFGHTFTWGGIDSVSDADTGEEITGWTLTSDSGFDWTHADVPEPSSLITALAAICFLASPYGRVASRKVRRKR